jgi:hypothetical protein
MILSQSYEPNLDAQKEMSLGRFGKILYKVERSASG